MEFSTEVPIFVDERNKKMETTKKRKKFNNSKYRFHLLEVGDTFKIAPAEAHTMRCALDSFNRRHNTTIEVFVDSFSDPNQYIVERVK